MTDPQIKFAILFHILAAVEGFSAWKGKSFIGKSIANFDEGPEFDRVRFDALRQQLTEFSKIGAALRGMLKLYARFKLNRFKFLFVSKSKRVFFSLARIVHNALGFVLRCTPLFSIPTLAVCYIKQIECMNDNVSPKLCNWVFGFIMLKVVCYVICAALNKYLLRGVIVKPEAPDITDIGKA